MTHTMTTKVRRTARMITTFDVSGGIVGVDDAIPVSSSPLFSPLLFVTDVEALPVTVVGC